MISHNFRINHALIPCIHSNCRWEGRPHTPPFKWGDGGEELPPHDTWLRTLDLRAQGLGVLIEPDVARADPAAADHDLEKVKEILMQTAGGWACGVLGEEDGLQAQEGVTIVR